MKLIALAELFRGKAIATTDEVRLQSWVASELRSAGVAFDEQVSIGKKDRLDFLIGSIAVELKTQGSLADLMRQLDRYACSERISEFLVLSTRRQLLNLPRALRDKPVFGVGVGAF